MFRRRTVWLSCKMRFICTGAEIPTMEHNVQGENNNNHYSGSNARFHWRCHTLQSTLQQHLCFAARSTVHCGTRPILRPYYMVSSRTPTIAFETDLVTEWLSSNTCRCNVLHEMSRLCASLSRRCCPIAPMRDTPTRLILVVDPRHLYL
jgi:hypothetical protein